MATKADLTAIRAELGAAEARLEATFEQVRAEIKSVAAQLETRIEQARSDTIKWVVGVAFAQVATLIAVLKLLPGSHP